MTEQPYSTSEGVEQSQIADEASGLDNVSDPESVRTADQSPDEKVRRRSVLKLIGLGAAVTAASGVGYEVATAKISTELLKPDTEAMPREVPPELQGKDIPLGNEHYRHDPRGVLLQALDAYKKEGGRPYYKRPPYYLKQSDLLKSAGSKLLDSGEIGLDTEGEPYEKLLHFSADGYTSIHMLYDIDPGSSTQQQVAKRLEALGPAINEPAEGSHLLGLTKREVVIGEAYGMMFRTTKAYIDQQRGEGRVSTAELFRYYLKQSGGDIVRSLLDTTIFLKMAARTDIEAISDPAKAAKSKNIYSARYKNAALLSSMFYDDFARELPLEGLVAHVSPDSKLIDYDVGENTRPQKDFDPANRAGLPYHIWNIFVLCAAADPEVAKRTVAAYYNGQENGHNVQDKQGKVKAEADFNAVERADSIRAIFDSYRV